MLVPATPYTLQSFVTGRWLGKQAQTPLASAVNGHTVCHTHAEAIDHAEALSFARRQGTRSVMALDFQQRAALLKALAAYLTQHREQLYAISAYTGATRADSWVDIEGGVGTLQAYAAVGAGELPSGNVVHEGLAMALGRKNTFAGTHILVPRGGVAVHINAFNFPVWGLLEKFAPSFLAGLPCIVKPATATSYLTEAAVRLMMASGLLPEGALQLIIGGTGDLLDRLGEQDVVTFTGSADTAARLRVNKNIVAKSVPISAEADSLNCAILGPEVQVGDAEFDLFVNEVAREMTAKAGQKCTAIRRVIVPQGLLDAVASALCGKLAAVVPGDPALASVAQQADVAERLVQLATGNEVLFGAGNGFAPRGEGVAAGAFFAPTLLLARGDVHQAAAHDVEAFGPVSTLLPYGDIDEAFQLAARGRGSLVASIVSRDAKLIAKAVPQLAAWHGRVLVLDRDCAAESTGHGSPLPQLKHGGPGRAGGSEELGGLRAVKHYLQRCAVQGSPRMLAAVTGEYVRGAPVQEEPLHPFRKHFDELHIGDSLLTHRRTVGEADIVNFGGISGDYFYMHFDEVAAKDSAFGKRIAHGYFVLSAAAGLFVSPAPGPVLANYGLDTLRFVKPVGIGDTIRARLTCKRKIDKPGRKDQPAQGVVAWDVQVTNQHDELVASYDILTLVLKKA